MGMYDYINCEYPLPEHAQGVKGWQTKDTPAQALDVYTIRADGSLWGEEYDIEDRSDPNAEGIMRLAGMATRVNKRPVPLPDFTGEIRFYSFREGASREWVEFSAYFRNGKLQRLNDLTPPTA